MAKSESRVAGHTQLTRRSFTQFGSAAADPSSDPLPREAIAKPGYPTLLDRACILGKGKAGVA
jgi:hypothetical protein